MIHMFWFCPIILGGVCEGLSAVLALKMTVNPNMLLSGVVPGGLGLPVGRHKVTAFSTLLAHRLILLVWRGAAPPTVSHWIRDLYKIICGMREKLIFPHLEIFPSFL